MDNEFTPMVNVTGRVSIPEVIYETVAIETPATREKLGLVIVGDHLDITEEGILSVNTEGLGGSDVESSDETNKVAILPDGTMEINNITMDKLVDSDTTKVILFGGNA